MLIKVKFVCLFNNEILKLNTIFIKKIKKQGYIIDS